MNKYNICVIAPEGYAPALALAELSELILFSIKELGFPALLQLNAIDPEATNILIGCHMLNKDVIPSIPPDTIIVNTEQVYSDAQDWNENTFEWMKSFRVWDYSAKNIANMQAMGLSRVQRLQIGYQKELSRIQQDDNKDIDVLFYGSVNDRRLRILNELKERGLNVQSFFGVYGEEKDRLIRRSKVVLNLHFYDSQIFEIIRVFYLLSNSVAVVSEVNPETSIDPMYLEGIYPAGYDSLVDACQLCVNDHQLRQQLEKNALEAIRKYPQANFMRELLDTNW